MDSINHKLFIFHYHFIDVVHQIKDNLMKNGFDSDKIVLKQLDSPEIDPQLIPNEELTQYECIVIIGASLKSVNQLNETIGGIKQDLKLVVANANQSFIYVFIDFGSNFNHLSFEEYLRSFGNNISDKLNQNTNQLSHLKPFESIMSGFICGQLINRSGRQSQQMFSYEIDSEIASYSFEPNRPVVVVGCGSLGFRIVMNLLKIGAKSIVLIDSDVVHKYNLESNCFNKCDVGLRKCDVVKRYAQTIRPDINIEIHYANVQQVSSQFFEFLSQTNGVIVTAVDNIETKRFINKVCLTHSLPFIDVGIDCSMFHIESIVPHLTESYFCHSDACEPEYPLCVVKSFPQIIEHCVDWSEMKFESWFIKKPKVAKSWRNCLETARLLFEKCFNHKARQLLFSLPLDHMNEDKSNFWADKKIPHPIQFDLSNQLHLTFIKSCAHLIAIVNNISVPVNEDQQNHIDHVIKSTPIPEFIPKRNKIIVTDPSVTAPNQSSEHEESTQTVDYLKRQTYSKEDDIQLECIYALANLRASMYDIEMVPISEIRRIYHKTIYCFDESLSTASAIASIELAKLLVLNGKYNECDQSRFKNKNYFFNLSNFDLLTVSEPGKPTKTKLSDSCYFTEWDYWLINESDNLTTLEDVLNHLSLRSGSVCTMMVMDDTKSVYLPELFPHHIKRKKQSMRDLISNYYKDMPKFVTLTVSFENEKDDIPGPSVKYILSDTSSSHSIK